MLYPLILLTPSSALTVITVLLHRQNTALLPSLALGNGSPVRGPVSGMLLVLGQVWYYVLFCAQMMLSRMGVKHGIYRRCCDSESRTE